MANFTVELSEIVKQNSNTLLDGVTKVFNFDYTLYDPTKKDAFETKFLNHFYFREIGVSTLERFQHYLRCKCDEVLPFYNMLFETALINYEKTVNYNLTEIYSRGIDKTDTVKGSTITDGTTGTDETSQNTLNRESDIATTGNKTNTLDSTTTHDDLITFNRDNTITEHADVSKTSINEVNGKAVESDTPQGLLSMNDIEGNVFATKATINDNSNSISDSTITDATKTEDLLETTDTTTTDIVDASTTDISTTKQSDDTTEVNDGKRNIKGTFENETSTTNTVTGSEDETSTRTTRGSYGVITEADMLKKHIELQQTLTAIERKFFDECEDLFMQIYERTEVATV